MATIRLLHISDLHICEYLNLRQISKRDRSALKNAIRHFTVAPTSSPTKLTRFLSFFRRQKNTLDGVIITGDIATTGRIFDLQKAFTVIKNRIEPIGVDMCLLPGNHDRWTPYRKGHDSVIWSFGYDPGGTDFHSIFSSYWGPEDVRTFPIQKDSFKVVTIAADLSLRSARDAEICRFINKHGQGKVYDDILVKMEKATLHEIDNHKGTLAVVWAIHFPPFSEDISSDLRLLDEKLLLEKADELGVSVILAGHSHIGRPYRPLPYETDVFCAGTLTEYNHPKNQFFIISFEDEGGKYRVELDNYEYDRLTASFRKRNYTAG